MVNEAASRLPALVSWDEPGNSSGSVTATALGLSKNALANGFADVIDVRYASITAKLKIVIDAALFFITTR